MTRDQLVDPTDDSSMTLNPPVATPTQDRTHRPRRWASLVAALAVFLGVALLAPAPASAAQPASVTVCFTVPGGYVYPGGAYTGNVNYQARTSTGAQPVQISSFSSGNGCIRWSVTPGSQFRFQAWGNRAGVITCGNTPWYLPVRAGSNIHLGTFNAYRSASNGRECL